MAYPTHPTMAIIGAGPYGLSLAAHLRATSVAFRIFGLPMHRWRVHMPNRISRVEQLSRSAIRTRAERSSLRQTYEEDQLAYKHTEKALDLLVRYWWNVAITRI